MRVAGLDGTKGGWVAIELNEGSFERDRLIQPIESDLGELAKAEVIAVDVPIGFGPDRRADTAARAFLRGNASTVFPTPSRDILEVPFGPGLGVSAQSHALGPRIIHFTALARVDPRIREVHPEVSFRAMNGGDPLRHRKRSAAGALKRVDLLIRHGIELVNLVDCAAVPLDDVLDAAAAAWSANRIAHGQARSLPDPPEIRDEANVAIWY
jgi:predicted RNase H-like nuclease